MMKDNMKNITKIEFYFRDNSFSKYNFELYITHASTSGTLQNLLLIPFSNTKLGFMFHENKIKSLENISVHYDEAFNINLF